VRAEHTSGQTKTSDMEPGNLKIDCFGRFARKFLYHYRSGKLAAIFDRCFYLEHDGELICIGSPAIGPGPLNALVEEELNFNNLTIRLAEGRAVTWNRMKMNVGGLRIDFKDAVKWKAPTPCSSADICAISKSAHSFIANSSEQLPRQGLAPLVFPSLLPDQGRLFAPRVAHSDGVVRQSVRPWIAMLEHWLYLELRRIPSSIDVEEPIGNLLGLGPGLTPSGDDFIGGLLVALKLLKCDQVQQKLARIVLNKARTKTTDLSAAHLEAAAQGEAIEAFHLLMNDILLGEVTRHSIHLQDISRIGHSSGWDMAAGGMFALRQWLRAHYRHQVPVH